MADSRQFVSPADAKPPFFVGVDVGGTFTDVVLAAGGRLVVSKLLSTPDDYGRAIVDGTMAAVRDGSADPGDLSELAHGTTVATNAILELKGARTGLLTTRGFRDLLEVRRMRVPRPRARGYGRVAEVSRR